MPLAVYKVECDYMHIYFLILALNIQYAIQFNVQYVFTKQLTKIVVNLRNKKMSKKMKVPY